MVNSPLLELLGIDPAIIFGVLFLLVLILLILLIVNICYKSQFISYNIDEII